MLSASITLRRWRVWLTTKPGWVATPCEGSAPSCELSPNAGRNNPPCEGNAPPRGMCGSSPFGSSPPWCSRAQGDLRAKHRGKTPPENVALVSLCLGDESTQSMVGRKSYWGDLSLRRKCTRMNINHKGRWVHPSFRRKRTRMRQLAFRCKSIHSVVG